MLNRHKDELSLEWDKRWEHLQLGKKTTWPFPSLPSLLALFFSRFFSFVSCPFLAKIARNQQMRLINVCVWFAVLEVMQFARDAHMAEGWMIAQEPYLKNENLGVSDIFPSSLLQQCPRKEWKNWKTIRLFPTKAIKLIVRAVKRQWLLSNLTLKLNVARFSLF